MPPRPRSTESASTRCSRSRRPGSGSSAGSERLFPSPRRARTAESGSADGVELDQVFGHRPRLGSAGTGESPKSGVFALGVGAEPARELGAASALRACDRSVSARPRPYGRSGTAPRRSPCCSCPPRPAPRSAARLGVNPPPEGRAAADPRQARRARCPPRPAPATPRRSRAPPRCLPRRLSPLGPAKHRAVDQQGAGPLEGRRHPLVNLEACSSCARRLQIAFGRLQQTPAARAHRQRPGSPKPAAGLLQPPELDAGLVKVADRDQRLDRSSRAGYRLGSLSPRDWRFADDRSQLLRRSVIVAGGQVDQAEQRTVPLDQARRAVLARE